LIDWITMLLPFRHVTPICGGSVVHFDADEKPKFEKLKPKTVLGSFETGFQICSHEEAINDDGSYSLLWVSGNPTKLFQGHNLWGTNNLHGLILETYDFLARVLPDHQTNDFDRQSVIRGAVKLQRIDINESFHLDSLADCRTWIRSAENSARMKYRGRGVMKEGTLYFGIKSERWATKIYAKGQEVRDHGTSKQPGIFGLDHCLQWADRSLRIEHVIRSKELQRLELDLAGNWDDNTAQVLHHELLQKLEFAEAMTVKPIVLEELSGALQGAYSLWKEGHDLRAVYSRPTFYRYRAKLLEHGIDISIQQQGKPDNVVPLVRILEAVPVGVPDWAHGTNLYFEPRRLA
jgi:II/X family phage/plasmid replication protein